MKKYLQVGEQSILDLSHDNTNMEDLVIINKSILTRLVHNLTTAPFHAIRHGLRERIMETKSIEELLSETKSFSQFYTVINYIKEQELESVSCNKVMEYGNDNDLGEL